MVSWFYWYQNIYSNCIPPLQFAPQMTTYLPLLTTNFMRNWIIGIPAYPISWAFLVFPHSCTLDQEIIFSQFLMTNHCWINLQPTAYYMLTVSLVTQAQLWTLLGLSCSCCLIRYYGHDSNGQIGPSCPIFTLNLL